MNTDDITAALDFLNAIPDHEWERVCGNQGRPEFVRLTVDGGDDVVTEWQIAQLHMGACNPGALHNYQTGDYMRRATAEEHAESLRAATEDGGRGLILVDDRACYVA